ncbi:hypothetical protein BDN70DRAFT_105749 [Pholiota conissans]|uniref:Uncharacterized protein n=1 Tax=Pholiota conissans TaxID=109636 RepID=A0A9P5ZCF5_9AGAR|nr:hypothetical protein BDN70DRAFT_105749 [Pholiota conissans]
MGYINFDARKKAEMRSRIEHAIQTLATWNHYVGSSPPDRGRNGDLTGSSRRSGEYDRDRDRGRAQDRNRISRDMDPPLSAHDVMGGGAAAVGGQFASQHGWKYSFNGTPQGSNPAVVFPQTGVAANGVPPAVPPGQLQWGNPNERAKSKSRSKSKSRNASRVASRKNSPEQEVFFIPPEIDSDPEDDYGAYYGQSQGTRQNGATQRAYEHSSPWANPDIASTNIPVSHSHLANSNGVSQPGGASGPSAAWRPPPAKNPGGSRVDPYGMRSLDQAINSVQYDPIYSSPQEYGNRLPDYNSLASGSGFQPVIPVIPPDTQAHQRKKKDKQRHVERRRARSSKWGYASESESEESEGYWDDNEHNKENRIHDIRERSQRDQQDALGRKRAQQNGPWHNLHVPAVGGRSNSGSQSQIPPVQPQRLHSQQDPSRQYMASYGGLPQDASSSMLNAGRKSRPGSRNPSPNPDTKRRPPPLDLTPPPVIAGLPQMRGSNQPVIPAMPPPSFADPALLAQYQFEQQKLDYQREREQHQQLVERERAFYQQRQFKQVPAHHSQMMEQQRQQQLMYQQQQQQYQLQQQQQAQQQQRPQYMYQHQQQMQQRQYR